MLLLWVVGCAPVLEDHTPYVTEPRVVAARMEPAEAEPGSPVRFETLVADASGETEGAGVDWAFCVTPKPLAELGPVAPACLDPGSTGLAAIGTGTTVDATLPDDGCSLFGPNPPPPVDGAAGGRPADPDVTGGYYQPTLAFLDADATLVPARIRCGLASVTQETYVAWNLGYHDNANPTVDALTVGGDDADGATVRPGGAATLTVGWEECPADAACGDGYCTAGEDVTSCAEDCTEPVGCGGAESYVVYDPPLGTFTTRREAISATWFATGGTWDVARNGREGEDAATTLENGWTAPDAAGPVWIGVVLRDERGGVGFRGVTVEVE